MPEPFGQGGRLPAELTSFVGRRRELAETKRLLGVSRLVTLTGMGGVGKTRLALRAASGLRRAFPDGVWFVRLAELTDPELLPHTIATELGLPDGLSGHVAELAEYLADKRLLLLLDNCEHVVAATATLAAKLLSATHGVRILATGRQLLRADGEQVLTVPPLSVPGGERRAHSESVALFSDRAAAVLPGFSLDDENRETVARICRGLDGIPLAIELAAARLRVLSPEQILQRLDDRFHLLTNGNRTAAPRQQTLRATFDWSFELCTPAERTVWAEVSVLAGGFGLDAAEAVCAGGGITVTDVLDLVAGMVDKSILLRRNGPYGRMAGYRMLETVREYGQLKLAESGREHEVRARHVAYWVALARRFRAESFGPHQLEWVERLRREHASVREALEYCVTVPAHVVDATEIAASLWNFWYAGGFVLEGRHWLTSALALDTARTPARGRALAAGAFMALQTGEPEAAGDMLCELRTLAEEFDDDQLRAGCAQDSGMASFFAGDLVTGRVLLEEALGGFRAAGDLQQVVNTLVLLAAVTFLQEDDAGLAMAEDALGLCETHRAGWSKTYALWAVAIHEWRRGAHRRAAVLLQDAIASRPADRSQLAFTIGALAWCAGSAGKHQRAAGLLGAAHAVWRVSGPRVAETSPYQAFDELCAAQARQALGTRAFARAFDATAGITAEEAISVALAQKPGKPRPAAGGQHGRPGGLTRREREIAELVADGLSNRAIAARLVIAQRTAETHVENILAKLGFTSRAQIAAWLAEHRAAGV
ncbi:ATP-binding protein [Amycolatopsis sp.]|uniref:ATP-binding protein n=1 Tax=Amycolatopsis sp. TaxID=37632 RepID=UPI002C753D2C|nr:LuxR C-terminal-related transcriptional regulator [Amycolatopsis sp.]HVV10314.1 LuxR C-terminal-related transcriptional regulator [Amycolatopsis sp.]